MFNVVCVVVCVCYLERVLMYRRCVKRYLEWWRIALTEYRLVSSHGGPEFIYLFDLHRIFWYADLV